MYIDLAKDLIEHYGTLIVRVFQESLEAWQQTVDSDGLEHKNRTRSNFIWDAFFHKICSELTGDSNFYFVERNGTILIVYKQTFLIKMKKLGTNRRPSYIKTRYAERFQNQLDMGLGDLVNVYLFYSLDTYGILINDIRLQCENGNSILWTFPLDGSLNITTPDLFYADQEVPNNRVRVKDSHRKGQQDEQAL
jgi:hypothetical protein